MSKGNKLSYLKSTLIEKDELHEQHNSFLKVNFAMLYSDFNNRISLPSYKKGKKKISESSFTQIAKSDPTTITNGKEITRVGGYVPWLIKQYFKIFPDDFAGAHDNRIEHICQEFYLFFEDLYKVSESLKKFNRFKRRLPLNRRDINKIKTIQELHETVSGFHEQTLLTKSEEKLRIIKEGIDVVYEDKYFEVLVPLTSEASYEVAGPPLTSWCTASTNHSSYYHNYTRTGKLYIIRDKSDIVKEGRGAGEPRPIYQLHFETSIFMNSLDERFDLGAFLCKKKSEGLKKFFKPMFFNIFINKDFNLDDLGFKVYIDTYGEDDNIKDLIETTFVNKVRSMNQIVVDEEDRGFKSFISMLGHERFLELVLTNAKRDVEYFEIYFTSYKGKGIDMPEIFGEFVNIKHLTLSGFVSKLPESIGKLKKLELVVFKNNFFTEVPKSFGNIKSFFQINFINSLVSMSDLPKPLVNGHKAGIFNIDFRKVT